MIKENPVLGVGFFNFSQYFQRYYPDDILVDRVELPHNIFIQVGTDTGIVGLLIFIALIFVAIRKSLRLRIEGCESNKNTITKCVNLSLLGYIVAGQFVTVTYYPFIWIHLSLIVALQNSFEKKGPDKKYKTPLN